MDRNIQAGLLTELSCQYDFSKLGIVLFAPITADSRSDFIAEVNGIFLKIQCKSSRESADGNSFSFTTCSKNWNTHKVKTYQGQIDYFYTCHKGQGYLIPIDNVGRKEKTLRLFAKDSNNPSISWAKDYEIEKVLQEIDPSLDSFVFTTKPQRISFCVDCGTQISYDSTRCRDCNRIYLLSQREKEYKINRSDLKKMIRTEPFTSIGKRFGVSDNAIRNWCDSYNLPRTKMEIKKYTDEEWENI